LRAARQLGERRGRDLAVAASPELALGARERFGEAPLAREAQRRVEADGGGFPGAWGS
jgi:hypothetical protein